MRRAQSADAEELEELENKLFPENSMNAHTLRSELRYSECLVEERDGRIVGYIIARSMGGLVDILRIGVLPEYRRQGIAKKLMRPFTCNKVTLLVHKVNDPAIKLYIEFGFQIVGHLGDSWAMLKS